MIILDEYDFMGERATNPDTVTHRFMIAYNSCYPVNSCWEYLDMRCDCDLDDPPKIIFKPKKVFERTISEQRGPFPSAYVEAVWL